MSGCTHCGETPDISSPVWHPALSAFFPNQNDEHPNSISRIRSDSSNKLSGSPGIRPDSNKYYPGHPKRNVCSHLDLYMRNDFLLQGMENTELEQANVPSQVKDVRHLVTEENVRDATYTGLLKVLPILI